MPPNSKILLKKGKKIYTRRVRIRPKPSKKKANRKMQ